MVTARSSSADNANSCFDTRRSGISANERKCAALPRSGCRGDTSPRGSAAQELWFLARNLFRANTLRAGSCPPAILVAVEEPVGSKGLRALGVGRYDRAATRLRTITCRVQERDSFSKRERDLVRERVRDRDPQIVVMRVDRHVNRAAAYRSVGDNPALGPYCSDTRMSGARARQLW